MGSFNDIDIIVKCASKQKQCFARIATSLKYFLDFYYYPITLLHVGVEIIFSAISKHSLNFKASKLHHLI